MPGATRLCRAGHVSKAVKGVKRNHLGGNTDRGGIEAASIPQKHPLKEGSRYVVLNWTARERSRQIITEASTQTAFSRPGSTEAAGGYRSGNSHVKMRFLAPPLPSSVLLVKWFRFQRPYRIFVITEQVKS